MTGWEEMAAGPCGKRIEGSEDAWQAVPLAVWLCRPAAGSSGDLCLGPQPVTRRGLSLPSFLFWRKRGLPAACRAMSASIRGLTAFRRAMTGLATGQAAKWRGWALPPHGEACLLSRGLGHDVSQSGRRAGGARSERPRVQESGAAKAEAHRREGLCHRDQSRQVRGAAAARYLSSSAATTLIEPMTAGTSASMCPSVSLAINW